MSHTIPSLGACPTHGNPQHRQRSTELCLHTTMAGAGACLCNSLFTGMHTTLSSAKGALALKVS